jgi:hypothetical protein
MEASRIARIAELNDLCRTAMGVGGRVDVRGRRIAGEHAV